MILHIAPDEKFIDPFINEWEASVETENHYLIWSFISEKKFVKSENIRFVNITETNIEEAVGDLNAFTHVFFHSFISNLSELAVKIPSDIKVVWCFFGAEAFKLSEFKTRFYQPLTVPVVKPFLKKKKITQQWALQPKTVLTNLHTRYVLHQREKHEDKLYRKALARMDFFAHFIHEDYLIIKKALKLKSKFVEFNYGQLHSYINPKDIPDKTEEYVGPPSILLGNSASPFNNHIDAIRMLSKLHPDNFNVVVPLSYGSPGASYLKKVTFAGEKFLKQRFKPLLGFVPPAEYNAIIKGCSVFIMNHIRSQAAANIMIGLVTGKKIFMNPQSTMFLFFKKIGAQVFSLTDNLEEEIFTPLSAEEIALNKKSVYSYFSENNVRARYKKLFEAISL